MNVNTIAPKEIAGSVQLERLAGNATVSEHDKVAEVSRQFEAVLLRQILAETQKPLLNSKSADNTTAGSIYRDMITNQLADSMSKSGSVGLAKTLERQLDRQVHSVNHSASTEAPATAAPVESSHHAYAASAKLHRK
jgi:Rod binding domain-containing protein